VELISCQYNSYSQKYKVAIEIRWNGLIFRTNQYLIRGILKFNLLGEKLRFSQTYANENVKDLDFFQKFGAGLIILSGMSEN